MSTEWIPEIELAIAEWASVHAPDLKLQDMEVHWRHHKKGLIAISKEKNLVLKIFLDPKDKIRLNHEGTNLELFQGSPFAEHVPEYLGSGTTSNGAGWLLTDFCPDPSFEGKRNVEKFLLKNMGKYFYPAMTKLYTGHGFKTYPAQEYLKNAKERLEGHPSKSKLLKLMDLIETELKKFPEYHVIETHIHHDLHRGNILTNGERVTIIDWEGMIRGLVLVDVFDFPKRYIKKNKFAQWFLLHSLKKGLVKRFFQEYRQWAQQEFSAIVPEGSEKLSFMLYVLERSLNTWEGRKVDRIKNKKDFEYKLLKALGI